MAIVDFNETSRNRHVSARIRALLQRTPGLPQLAGSGGARIDAAALVRYARARGNATAAGALGAWLERERERLGVPNRMLADLRALAPCRTRYALGAKPGEGKAIQGWNVILPIDVERRFEGL